MSTHSRNWLKFGALVGLAFVLGLFFAGLLDFPRNGFAQEISRTPIVRVNAPEIPGSQPLINLSDAFAAVVKAVRPSVVYIVAEQPAKVSDMGQMQLPPGFQQFFPQAPQRTNPHMQTPMEEGSGSGFIVSPDGYILTNNHVIEGATRISVTLLDGREFPAKVIGSDPLTDVAVIKINADNLTPAALGSSANTQIGEWVLAIGNPLGNDLTFSVTEGIVSAKGRGLPALNTSDRQIQDFIQTDAVINRGNSGGPLVNVRGEVIGINAAIASSTGYYTGYGFAVPIDLARDVMNQIISRGHVTRTGLGVMVQNPTASDAAYYGIDSVTGVLVETFPPDQSSPAKAAGIEPGDLIVSVDGQPVKYVSQLQQMIGFRKPGEVVTVDVLRRDGKHQFRVPLETVSGGPDTTTTTASANHAPPATAASRLGLQVEPLTSDLAQQIDVPSSTSGLLIKLAINGSSAEGKVCGLDEYTETHCPPEVITRVEGVPVKSEADLQKAFSRAHNGYLALSLLSSDNNGGTLTRIVHLKLNK
jgi:serine protease Do